jgi:KDO2-lipid IV(A) lauroyltransferase
MSFFVTPFKWFFIVVFFGVFYFIGFFPWNIQLVFAKFPAWLLSKTSRFDVILKNYEICFPDWNEKERIQWAHKQCHQIASMPLAMLNSLHRSSTITSKVKKIKGLEYLEKLREEKKGCLLVGGHFSSMDIANRYLSQHFDVAAVYQKGEDGLANWFMEKIRRRLNVKLIEKSKTIQMIRWLKDGGILWYAPDQSYGGSMKTVVDFFGQKINALSGWEKMVEATKNAEFCLIDYHYDAGEYVIEIHPPFEEYREMSSHQIAQKYMTHIEQNAKKNPEQYYWVHRRFKSMEVDYEN